MNSIISQSSRNRPVMLGAIAALCFASVALLLPPTLDRDAGVPNMPELTQAHGQVASLSAGRYGVKFRLSGRTETLSYPSKAGASDVVESVLATAGTKPVTVLFDPNPDKPWFSSDAHYTVWHIAIGGQPVRTIAQTRAGWRSDNWVAAWLFPCFLSGGIYFAVLAWRAQRARIRFDSRSWIDFS